MSERLCVVMPVYNEEAVVGAVLEKWTAELDSLAIDYVIRPYNDGSKDGSLSVMREIAAKHWRIDVRDKLNGGHGNTILAGYREAAADGFDWVFQIDSDDEMGPDKFGELWSNRAGRDFLVGIRDGRRQALVRKIVSFVSRLCVRLFYGKGVWDVNTPYRLMRVSAFKRFFVEIPMTTFAPNVILSGLAARHKFRLFETRVPQHDRTTGEVSIRKWKLLKAAARGFVQTIWYAWSSASAMERCKYLACVALAAVAIVSATIGFANGWREYDFQWDPAKLLMMGENPYLYSLEHKPVLHPGFMEKFIEPNQVPSCLYLLAPFTFLPQLEANYAWDACNLLFTIMFLVFAFKLWRKDIGDFGCALVGLLLLSGTPWRILIGNGQHLMFSLAFFVAALWADEKGRSWLSGALLAIAMFKYTTTAPLAFVFIARRSWMPMFICGAIHVALSIVAGCAVGESPIALISQALKVGSGLTGQGGADVASLARSFGLVDPVSSFALAGYVAYGCLCVAIACFGATDWLLKLATLAVVSNVACYHRCYDFVTLLFPLAVVLRDWRAKGLEEHVLCAFTVACVGWTFFGSKAAEMLKLDANYVLIEFCMQHALLFALLFRLAKCRHVCKLSYGHP
ncbi:MAG: glycosyltransferase [Kiritimatiellae bacterium]|nr:glycosyltransferase [Kiritimatiellia bacterium]